MWYLEREINIGFIRISMWCWERQTKDLYISQHQWDWLMVNWLVIDSTMHHIGCMVRCHLFSINIWCLCPVHTIFTIRDSGVSPKSKISKNFSLSSLQWCLRSTHQMLLNYDYEPSDTITNPPLRLWTLWCYYHPIPGSNIIETESEA